MAEFEWTTWSTIVGLASAVFAGARAWGKHEAKIQEFERLAAECRAEDVMTEEKCEKLHQHAREQSEVQVRHYQDRMSDKLTNLQEKLEEVKSEQKELTKQLSGIMGQFASMITRMGGSGGGAL